ncbi:hypothetical protein AGR4C_pa60091 [Agrobacterium tumefaciens str. Kerr 14]|uniref:Uncharacterized protein n=1 Tax=Agrobacterium tumefaciens str. Kerr 14 TaxID=1183424 RepID=A0A1S7SDA3_AGRTU|nr:hypothetical protein AGR4C_pa60091 [Agrobacterium tumefaciens str. Kerr 14]
MIMPVTLGAKSEVGAGILPLGAPILCRCIAIDISVCVEDNTYTSLARSWHSIPFSLSKAFGSVSCSNGRIFLTSRRKRAVFINRGHRLWISCPVRQRNAPGIGNSDGSASA